MTAPPPADHDPGKRLDWLRQDAAEKVRTRQRSFSVWKTTAFWMRGLAAAATATAGLSIMNEWLSPDQAGALAVAAAVLTALLAAYDPVTRTARVAVERAAWTRLLGEIHELAHLRTAAGMPDGFSDQELDELNRLWARHCDLMHDDAAARTTS